MVKGILAFLAGYKIPVAPESAIGKIHPALFFSVGRIVPGERLYETGGKKAVGNESAVAGLKAAAGVKLQRGRANEGAVVRVLCFPLASHVNINVFQSHIVRIHHRQGARQAIVGTAPVTVSLDVFGV